MTLDAISLKDQISGKFDNLNSQPAVQFIVLHYIQPYEEKPFADFLKWLKTQYDVVSYSRAVELAANGSAKKATAAISFDDGLLDNVVAAKIMNEHDVTGCFFVVPDIVGETSPEILTKFCHERLLYAHTDAFMNWDQIESLKDAGHEIGNHSQSHLNLKEQPENEFIAQVERAKEEITSRLGQVNHFAWPYGRFFHFSAERVEKIFEMGHTSCASAERGAHSAVNSSDADSNLASRKNCILRDSLEMNWPLAHCKYFLSKSTRNPIQPDQVWKD